MVVILMCVSDNTACVGCVVFCFVIPKSFIHSSTQVRTAKGVKNNAWNPRPTPTPTHHRLKG